MIVERFVRVGFLDRALSISNGSDWRRTRYMIVTAVCRADPLSAERALSLSTVCGNSVVTFAHHFRLLNSI
jgi:hypothetical protein